MTGTQIAIKAMHDFFPADASRAHVAAGLDLWRQYHGWVIDDSDVDIVLAEWEDQSWPASMRNHQRAQRASNGGPHA